MNGRGVTENFDSPCQKIGRDQAWPMDLASLKPKNGTDHVCSINVASNKARQKTGPIPFMSAL